MFKCSDNRKFKQTSKLTSWLSLILLTSFLAGCYRVDVPSFGDAAMRKTKHQVIDVNAAPVEKIKAAVRVSPQELSRKNAQTEAKGAWELWPASDSIPVKFDVDLAAFNKRPKNNQPLSDAVIIIDPSHGSELDIGSVGNLDGKAIGERQITLELALKLKVVLESAGAKVYLLRDNDDWKSLHYRIADAGILALDYAKQKLANSQLDQTWIEPLETAMQDIKERNNDRKDIPKEQSGLGEAWGYGVSEQMRQILDLEGQLKQYILISLNMAANSQLSSETSGFEAYYLTSDFIFDRELENMGGRPDTNGDFAFASNVRANPAYTYKTDQMRQQLANAIYDAVLNRVTHFARNGNKNQQVGTANFTSLRETGFANCALQCGFISNESDLRWIMQEENQAKLCQAIGEGIYNYFCLSNWPTIDGLSHVQDNNWKLASDAYREQQAGGAILPQQKSSAEDNPAGSNNKGNSSENKSGDKLTDKALETSSNALNSLASDQEQAMETLTAKARDLEDNKANN